MIRAFFGLPEPAPMHFNEQTGIDCSCQQLGLTTFSAKMYRASRRRCNRLSLVRHFWLCGRATLSLE